MKRHFSIDTFLGIASLLLITLTLNVYAAGCGKRDDNSKRSKLDTAKITPSADIPYKEGETIKGRVTCNGEAVANVEVSDGIEVTQTDRNGVYHLPSKKKYGYVFISVPSGYEVSLKGNTPQFFQLLVSPSAKVERHDFILTKVDNSRHAILAVTDFHLCNRSNLDDLGQFQKVAGDINATATELRGKGYKVYAVSMGDESWDQYWYKNNLDIAGAMQKMQIVNAPLFHCLGNHDNDPYCADDWQSEQPFIRLFPAYYSFNAGNNHYIVLDDVQYVNEGASEGHLGQRNYNACIIGEELAWLKKDLALLKDKNQCIVVAMHIQLFNEPNITNGVEDAARYRLDNHDEFVQAFSGFSNVHLLTGHTHVNYSVDVLPNIREHNTASICATWWWTGKLSGGKQHICRDGSPGGYGVYLSDATNFSWYYKGYAKNKNYQFRTYDLNSVYMEDHGNSTSVFRKYVHGYNQHRSDNEILINVFNYDNKWKVEASEGGKPLMVTRIYSYDPLHVLCYNMARYNEDGAEPTSGFDTAKTNHLFRCYASEATSTVNIKVTDEFGNVYMETMTRPKAFDENME